MKIKVGLNIPRNYSDNVENISYLYVSQAKKTDLVGISGENNSKLSSQNLLAEINKKDKNIIYAVNFENINNEDGTLLSTRNMEGLTNIPLSFFTTSVYKKEIWYDRINNKPMEEALWSPVILNTNQKNIRDYNISNHRTYKYSFRTSQLLSSGGRVEDADGQIFAFSTNWQGWSIVEMHATDTEYVYTAEPKDVWKFKYNVSSGQFSQQISKTQQDVLAQFPNFSHGLKNFANGNVECLIGRDIINADYTDSHYVYKQNSDGVWGWVEEKQNYINIGGYKESLNRYSCAGNTSASQLGFKDMSSNESMDLLEKWMSVCYSGNPKLLRDEKGQSFIIQISDPSYKIEEGWQQMPISISFSWTQIDDPKKYMIYQAYD